jgi:hypothetical protein
MSKAKVFSMHLLLLVLLTSSCSRREETMYEPGTGGVRIDLATEAPATRADVPELSPDDFKVEIINKAGVIFKRWGTYAEYKSQDNPLVQMNVGDGYTLRATLGDSTASGWNAWFFKGESVFSVLPQQTVEVRAVCRMANVKVAVNYGDNVINDYVSYRTIVSNSRGRLDFDMEHKDEAGYMPVGPLTVDVELTDGDGRIWYFRNGSQIEAYPGDFITLNLDTDEIPSQEIGLIISIDRTTNDSTVNVELPSYMLPKDAPLLIPEAGGFDENGTLTMVEGTEPNANISFNAVSGLTGCTMTVGSAYLSSLGWPQTLDFLSLSADEKNILERDGLTYVVEEAGTMGAIDFSAVARKFAYSEDAGANAHSFTIKITDALGKTAEATFVITPRAASKSIAEISEGNVWAARIENVVLSTEDGDPELLYPEVRAEGGQWTRPSCTSTSVSGTTNTFTITGLTPGTGYSVRARYNNGASETVREVTTEEAQQVENAGFEDWDEWEYYVNKSGLFWGDDVYQTNYAPYLNDGSKWWDCNNSETTPGDRTNTGASYKSFPMVSYVAGREGGKSAQLMTIAISNTATSSTAPSPTVGFGKIFTGVYGGTQGRSFSSRPEQLSFWYKYAPCESDSFKAYIAVRNGDTVIGEGTLTSSASVSSWVQAVVDITYSRTDLKADTIYVEFVSGSDTGKWQYGVDIVYGGERTANVHGGSTLTVDDIELIYE